MKTAVSEREIMAFGKRYGAPDIPADDLIADFYEIAVERLARAGIARYEISNFARPGFESRHNLKYWRREPYVGFGADAHSFDGDMALAESRIHRGLPAAARKPGANACESHRRNVLPGPAAHRGVSTGDWSAFPVGDRDAVS